MAVGVHQFHAARSDQNLSGLGVASKLVSYEGLHDSFRLGPPLRRGLHAVCRASARQFIRHDQREQTELLLAFNIRAANFSLTVLKHRATRAFQRNSGLTAKGTSRAVVLLSASVMKRRRGLSFLL